MNGQRRLRMTTFLLVSIVLTLAFAFLRLAILPVGASGSPDQVLFAKATSTRRAPRARATETSQPIISTAASPQTPPVDLRGIYVVSYSEIALDKSEKLTALTNAFNVPGVDGLVLTIGWDAIEPDMGQYQWNMPDKWMSAAVSASKKIDLAITAYNAPTWLFQTAPDGGGAKPLKFTFIRKPSNPTCLSETIAAPWDPAFLAQWDSMLAAVSDHLKSTGTYDALTLLRLTGINKDTGELHLPSEPSGSSGGTCTVTDTSATWQQAGCRPSLLLHGWDGITSSFKKRFPDKSFSVAIIASAHPFPAIAQDGAVIKGKIPNQNLPLLTLASQKFPGHLVIQNNSLYADLPAQPETIQSAQTLGTLIAFQTNEDIVRVGAACGDRKTDRTSPCTAAAYLAELQTGIYPLGKSNPLRAQHIEVFAADVNAFPDVIQQAHQELTTQP